MRGRTMAVLSVLILCLVGYGTAGAVVLQAQVDVPDAPDLPGTDLPDTDDPDVPDAPDISDPDLPGSDPDEPVEPGGGGGEATPTPTVTPSTTPTPAPTVTPSPSRPVVERKLTLRDRRHLVLKGRLSGGPKACWRKAPLTIRRGSTVLKRIRTDLTGRYRVKLKDRPGRYSVTAVTVYLPHLVCGQVTSVTTHRHRS